MESDSDRNLAAVLTPPGVGAIAVIHIHGPSVPRFLAECFSRAAIAGRCIHGELSDGELSDAGRIIDDPVIVLDAGKQSADINLHGGTWIVQSCLQLLERFGFRIIDAAQLPLPALALDAADEIEAEILAHLPMATTELAVRVLLAQYSAWEHLMAEPPGSAEIARILADRSLHWLLHPPRLALVGIPNAGKSTLANQLFGQQRSITADLPGTTRDWVGEIANIDGLAVQLLDTPGIRCSDDAIESSAIERASIQLQSADAVLLLLDATRMDDANQQTLVQRFAGAIQVFNKVDAAGSSATLNQALCTVATTGQGIGAVRSAIRKRFNCESIEIDSAKCWTPRQRKFLLSISE